MLKWSRKSSVLTKLSDWFVFFCGLLCLLSPADQEVRSAQRLPVTHKHDQWFFMWHSTGAFTLQGHLAYRWTYRYSGVLYEVDRWVSWKSLRSWKTLQNNVLLPWWLCITTVHLTATRLLCSGMFNIEKRFCSKITRNSSGVWLMQHVMFWWQTDHFISRIFVWNISSQWMLLINWCVWPVLHQVHILLEGRVFLSLLWFRYIHPDLENQVLQQDPGDPEHINTCSQSDVWPQYNLANQSSREVEEVGLLTGIPSRPGKPGTPTLPWNKEEVSIWTKVLFPSHTITEHTGSVRPVIGHQWHQKVGHLVSRSWKLKEQTEPSCLQQQHIYSPSLLSVLLLLSAPHLLCGPSLLEAPGVLESLVAPEGPVDPEDLEDPAEHKLKNKNVIKSDIVYYIWQCRT